MNMSEMPETWPAFGPPEDIEAAAVKEDALRLHHLAESRLREIHRLRHELGILRKLATEAAGSMADVAAVRSRAAPGEGSTPDSPDLSNG